MGAIHKGILRAFERERSTARAPTGSG